jgi:hypothetical protein
MAPWGWKNLAGNSKQRTVRNKGREQQQNIADYGNCDGRNKAVHIAHHKQFATDNTARRNNK